MKTLIFGYLAIGALLTVLPLTKSDAQVDTAAPPTAPLNVRIDLGSNNIVRLTRTSFRFQRIGINPNQVVGVAIKFPAAMAGQTIVIEPLDGGTVRTDSTIDSNGVLTFGYNAGTLVGNARLSLYNGNDTHLLQFWVRDLQHPERNPHLPTPSVATSN